MTLSEYLAETKEKANDFAARADISQPYVSRLLSGERFPRPEMVERIEEATGGKVTAGDWFAARRASPEPEPTPAPQEAA